MQQTTEESAPTETPTEGNASPRRKLTCVVLGRFEVKAGNMPELRRRAQQIVNDHAEPKRGPYRIDVCENGRVVPELGIVLCHRDNKREHVIGMFRRPVTD
jgi:hypothetical protein